MTVKEAPRGAYCFRIPFRMSSGSLLDLPEPECELFRVACQRVWLAAVEPVGPLRDAFRIVIRGEGFDDEAAARDEGERRDVVCRALARLHLGADFGERAPYGQMTEAGRLIYAQELGHPVMSDVPGVSTLPCDPELRFLRSQAEGYGRPSPERSAAVSGAPAELGSRLSPVERLAFDLYSGSYFQPSADARLLMLMMVVETLLDLRPRSDSARAHVQRLIDATDRADLPTSDRQALKGSLAWLFNESIGQAGRRLATRLEPRRYGGRSPSSFFTKCYTMRSALVHG